jgi:hypothetical protein
MNKLIAVGIVLAVTLMGCGGGGDGASSGTTSGDYYTFDLSHSASNTSPYSLSYTRAYPTLNADGSGVRVDTYSTTAYPLRTYNLGTASVIANSSFVSGGLTTTCTFSPSYAITASPTAAVGTTWNNNSTETCTGGSPSTSTFNSTGSITVIEPVVTSAGTFTAKKFVFTQTEVRSGVYTQVLNYTCWADVATGRTVKCDYPFTYTPVVGTVVTGTESIILAGFRASGISSFPTVARFAGTWSGSYAGSSSGTCSSLVVSTTGVITGSCVDINVGAFTVTGTVNVSGTVSMTASTGPTFTGSLSSPSTGSGSWSGVPSGGGTWTATHQ